jgi:spoIIIJ-associated protein
MRLYGSKPEPPLETAVEAEAPTFDEAVHDAAVRLGVKDADLAIEILDPGRSADSSGGYRAVRIRARRRSPSSPPDGARSSGTRFGSNESRRGSRTERPPRTLRREPVHRAEPVSYGPPPPPMPVEQITPEIVAVVRDLTVGLLEGMGFASKVDAEKSQHGIRIGIDAGDLDQFLIGKDGETLSALQHLLGRMIRAKMPDDSPPRVEVDVAGFRDRQIEKLRDLARDLVEEVRQTGEEATTEPLPASERRIVHLEVAEAKGMETVTVGDGYYKRVIVRKATEKTKEGT